MVLLVCFSFLSLASCGQKKESNVGLEKDNKVEKATSSETATSELEISTTESVSGSSEEVTTENSNEPSRAKDVHFNGSYYSVQGRYGEVIIVNKKHPLASSYAPGENAIAQAAFFQLRSAMQNSGFDISNHYSGFRSYDTQASLYNNYAARDGQANADRYSARPGYSEHQTGLAFDLMDSAGNLLQEASAVKWLEENAHQYGFIVRYITGKESVTGYMAETWHVRYIGQEAGDIYQSGLTLEEYFGISGGDYQ